jgi:DnaJ-class molecular chaperone
MTLRPCLGSTLNPYGHTLTRSSRCAECTGDGYGNTWRRTLVPQAIALHPWCTDCGTEGDKGNPLTGDHLRWPVHTVGDIEVVCRSCNSARGSC